MDRPSDTSEDTVARRRRGLEEELAKLEDRLRRFRRAAGPAPGAGAAVSEGGEHGEHGEHGDEGRGVGGHGDGGAWPAPEDNALREALERATEERAALLRAALRHFDEGRHGRCRRCDGEIAAARLAVVPWAITCRGCSD